MYSYDDDDYDYEGKPTTRVTFIYTERDKNGRETINVSRTVHGEDTEYLPNLLEAFTYFLHGMTFTYVDGVAVLKDGEINKSSFDV
ncbi:hypothetical protein UFOVP63_5 [uncultured Caudovirales phage]|uniref:Uncharacterized protein n=1 Tax=uncultured Caudovirales phage TaxID=2100421 RepID=A0A6J5KTY8_9CAUD|nr:hypothetical protein UFOVP63_5 [uncultured Caudovirales phage]